jgi:hypothetical protein
MNKIYTLFSGLMLIAAPSFAQTIYSAVRAGDWHASIPSNTIWQGAEPPMNCGNCVINLTMTGGGIVNLNTHVVLSGASTLNIGDGTAGNEVTVNVANSGVKVATALATDTSKTNSISMVAGNTQTLIHMGAGSSLIVAPNVGNNGDMDGVFTVFASPGAETFSKTVGFAPDVVGVTSSGMTLITNQDPNLSSLNGGASGTTLNPAGTLPIILSSFTASLSEGVVDLDWTTALEINGDHFVVERSANAGASWDAIGTVEAHGNSVVALNYSFADNKPVQGTAEYRLQMVDKDGVYKYSPVKTVRLGAIASVSVYPNPARDFVNVTLGNASGFTLIRLYNQGGQLLQEKSLNNPGGTIVSLAVSGYPQGNYVVVVTGADGSRASSKVLVTK